MRAPTLVSNLCLLHLSRVRLSTFTANAVFVDDAYATAVTTQDTLGKVDSIFNGLCAIGFWNG